MQTQTAPEIDSIIDDLLADLPGKHHYLFSGFGDRDLVQQVQTRLIERYEADTPGYRKITALQYFGLIKPMGSAIVEKLFVIARDSAVEPKYRFTAIECLFQNSTVIMRFDQIIESKRLLKQIYRLFKKEERETWDFMFKICLRQIYSEVVKFEGFWGYLKIIFV